MFLARSEIHCVDDSLIDVSNSKDWSTYRIQQFLLMQRDLANIVDLLHTIGSKLDSGSEEVTALVLVEWAVYKGGLDDTLSALCRFQQALGKSCTGHCHR
jgi:hypothetical protein